MTSEAMLCSTFAEQLLETQMLLEDAPLRLLSIHHTAMTNEDLCQLFHLLSAAPEDNAAQAHLTCLKLGPAAQQPLPSEPQRTITVPFASETLQRLTDLLGSLSELQVMQVWGLQEDQQASLAGAWESVKGEPGHVTRSADSFRICVSHR